MWRVLSTCLVLLSVSVSAGLAEERVLLYPQALPGAAAASGAGEHLRASPSARSAAVPDGHEALRKIAVEQGTVKVIVGTRVPFAAEGNLPAAESQDQRSEIAAAARGIRERFAAAIRRAPDSFRSYDSIPFVAIEVTADELDRLAADPDVISIAENVTFDPLLPKSVHMVQGSQAHAAGFTGAGQTIAIIDTGVDKTHPFLGGRVVAEACFSQGKWCPGKTVASTAAGSGMPCPIGGCAHGTHVAGIAAGAINGTSGVANGANIIAIQVFSNLSGEPRASSIDILAALEHVYALRGTYAIAAVNMSLGGGEFVSNCDSDPRLLSITAVIRNLRSAGIATVAASGNDGFTDSLSYPACISTVVSVGAVSDVNWGACTDLQPTARDKVACYSNSAAFLSLLAPGSRILSSGPRNTYFQTHGTSMAAPHVAGAWAVLKQKAPGASVDEVLAALQNTGTRVTDHRNGITKPRINVKDALDQLPDSKPVLALTRAGTGRGSVTFSPTGTQVSCTANCVTAYDREVEVTLTASPDEGSVFSGWSGDCSGTAECTLTMSAARHVTAGFASATADTRVLSYSKQGSGHGSVTFSPAGSQASCTESGNSVFVTNTQVRVTARALEGSAFRGWSGACRGMRDCRVRMNATKSVTALFDTVPVHTLSYTMEGRGTVSFMRPVDQADCTAGCTRRFSSGTRVTLTAKAAPGWRFVGWRNGCRGKRSCSIVMNGARSVTAIFSPTRSVSVRP